MRFGNVTKCRGGYAPAHIYTYICTKYDGRKTANTKKSMPLRSFNLGRAPGSVRPGLASTADGVAQEERMRAESQGIAWFVILLMIEILHGFMSSYTRTT